MHENCRFWREPELPNILTLVLTKCLCSPLHPPYFRLILVASYSYAVFSAAGCEDGYEDHVGGIAAHFFLFTH